MTTATLIAFVIATWPNFGSGDGNMNGSGEKFELLLSAGYGQSSFSEEFLGTADQEMSIPVGLQLLYRASGSIQAGFEFETTLKKYEWDELSQFGIGVSLSQTLYGGVIRYLLPLMPGITAYCRGGAGLYTGSHEATLGGLLISHPLDNAFGYNLGAGLTAIGGRVNLGSEFVYHFVKHRYEDQPENEPWEMNNWSVRLIASIPI